ncbi:MAG: hypothetical protein Q9165_007113 [Trypethelium subeluteriae]
MISTLSCSFAVASGILTHQLYFKRGEHHLYGPKYVEAFLDAYLVLSIGFCWYFSVGFGSSLKFIGQLSTLYFVGLYSSLVAYRGCFHPLNRFPGPITARLSNLWFSTKCLNADAHKQLYRLHRDYSTDFLRIGSSDLSITHPQGIAVIYGPNSRCIKSDWYDTDFPNKPMMAERDKTKHDKRRRFWSLAFSDKALRGYQQRIKRYEEELRDQLKTFQGMPVNIKDWFNFYAFDTMGDLAFGESFGNLTTADYHPAAKLIKKGLDVFSLMRSSKSYKTMNEYCWRKIESHYREKEHDIPDIASNLFVPFKSRGTEPSKKEWLQLHGDSRTIIVAGSDTTAATLTFLFYFLTHEPLHQARLRDEILPFVDGNGDARHADLQDLPYLNGCINETFRLQPLLPATLRRLTPPEGIQVGDTHIPGNMVVFCPQYVLGRIRTEEEIYTHADTFIPERWFSKPELIKTKGAFAPFSMG